MIVFFLICAASSIGLLSAVKLSTEVGDNRRGLMGRR
jgi:hypothetical protein